MRNVDAISCMFGPVISSYIHTASVLSDTDRKNRPNVYTTPICDRFNAADYLTRLDSALAETPILTTKALLTHRAVIPVNIQLLDTTPVTHISSVPVLLYSHYPQYQLESIPCISTPTKKHLKSPVFYDVSIP